MVSRLFFVTMTWNTNWKEIKDILLIDQQASDRNELVTRVFKHRADSFRKDPKSDVLGESVYLTENIKFQKKGLPHYYTLVKISKKHII
uniref:Helitron_like_N domain-containing protein n=1 Tax=Rhabditophanes sp. KR3021 TaxID=114890 RepID=A0AC35UG96_9BILA